MTDKPHTVALGAFVVGALIIGLVTLLFLVGTGIGGREKVVMVFDGSVTGLNVGAPLALRGVQVGQVTNIELILDSDTVELIMLVEADFDPGAVRLRGSVKDNLMEELLARGLRAQLNTQSLLTGLLFIQLDFHPDSELKLADIDSPYFQFPTVPTDFERIARKLQDIDIARLAEDVNRVVQNIDAVVGSGDFQALPGELNTALASLTRLSERLSAQVESSGPRLDALLEDTAQTVATANAELPQIARLVQENLVVVQDAIEAFEQSMQGVDELVAQDSPTLFELNRALDELARAGRSLQALARTLEEQPEALIRGRSGRP